MGKTLTVAGLIEVLQRFDPNLPVYTEGCDCMGEAADAEIAHAGDEPYVIITRS